MNLFQRISQLWVGFWSQLIGRSEANNSHLAARGYVEKQKKSLRSLKENITELIFQRKRFERRLSNLEAEKANLKLDVEAAALENRDELALNLMERLEDISGEIKETIENLRLVEGEIQMAKDLEKELKVQIDKSQSQLAILASKMESVKMRENMKSHMSHWRKDFAPLKPGFSQIEENIMQLEARMESLSEKENDLQKEVIKLRRDRHLQSRRGQLIALKKRLKAHSLPGRVIEAEVVGVTH